MSRISRTIFGGRTSWLRPFPRLQRALRIRYLERRRYALPVADGMIFCRVLGRYKFYVDSGDLGISPHIMLDGYWEPRTTEAIVDLVRPGMTTVDVGANLGYFTLLMAALVGPAGRVLAFEPNPRPAGLLQASLFANGLSDRVSLHADPLDEADDREITMVIPQNHPGGTRILLPSEGQNSIAARTRRLDGFPAALDADLVKIDAEGMEEVIWRGMSAMIAGSRLRYVILEFSGNCYSENGAALIDQAVAGGFTLMRLDDRRGMVATSRSEILAFPSERQQMLLFLR